MEVSPQPMEGGYVHVDIRRALERERTYDALVASFPIVPMRRRDYIDHQKRDVAAPTDADGIAEVYPDKKVGTVTMVLDERLGAMVMYAVQMLIANSESHAQEVRMLAEQFPVGSYGATNRLTIAARNERIARRLRALDTAYRDAITERWHGI